MMRLYRYDDFTAHIRILSVQEGGRLTPAHNGIRWDFAYADDRERQYMIWPDFHDASGASLAGELPVGITLAARMVIVVDDMRAWHASRLRPGVRFYCHEGSKRVAIGEVAAITGLHLPRASQNISQNR